MVRACVLVFALAVGSCPVSGQNVIQASPSPLVTSVRLDAQIGGVWDIGISGSPATGGVANVRFKFDHVQPRQGNTPNFIVLSASSGTTPASLEVGLNENVIRGMVPGLYGMDIVFSTIDQSPPSTAGVNVTLRILAPEAPTVQTVVSTASYQPNLSPGAMVSIFGTHFGQPSGSAPYDEFGI